MAIMAGVAIGGMVALEAIMGGPVSGAYPARSIGPALVSGQVQHLWIYILAPITGMFLAHPMWRCIKRDECCRVQKK